MIVSLISSSVGGLRSLLAGTATDITNSNESCLNRVCVG